LRDSRSTNEVGTTIVRPVAAAGSQSRDVARIAAAIAVTRQLPAPARRVFAAWLDAALTPRWLFATATQPVARVAMDARPAGNFDLVETVHGRTAHFRGRYLSIEPVRRIAFTLECAHEWPGVSRVDVVIREVDGTSLLKILHTGVPAASRRRWRGRWIGMLYGLATLVAQRDAPGRSAADGCPR
jgi:uncharacterized protein YndB with AHSA1/START domain